MATAANQQVTLPSNFKKQLKTIGIEKYTQVGNSIILASKQSSRSARKSELQAVTKFFKGSKLIDDGRSGYVEAKISNKTVKIFSKPERTASGIVLKPSFFSGLTDTEIPYSQYGNKLLASIQENQSLDASQKKLLESLARYHLSFSPSDLANFKKIYAKFKQTIPINTINNDFGEVLGPLAVIKKKLLPITPSSAKIFIPGKSNEPLLDYRIIVGAGPAATQYKISAKSGDTTNTLKPGDVMQLIDQDAKLKRKHAASHQYNVLKLLAEGSWKQGPIDALGYLKKQRYSEAKWLVDTTYAESTRQQSENSLVEISKKSLDFSDIYFDATNAKVYYVKFSLSNDGTPQWEILKDEKNRPESKKRIEFRSKNYVGRPNGDKLGFQPK
jgi:hypothetical protein